MTAPQKRSSRFGEKLADIGAYMSRQPGLDYLMIRIIVLVLAGLGLVMVFSSSMTYSVAEGSSAWGTAGRQAIMVLLGFVVFGIALRIPIGWIRKIAPWLMWVTLVLLIAVLIPGIGTGRESVGSQSWIAFGPLQLQPSEIAKITIAIWGASFLANKRHTSTSLRSPFVQYTLMAVLWFGLIVAQGDLGMAISFAIVVAFTLIFAGVDLRVIVAAFVIAVIGLIAVFVGGGFRSQRFHTYFDALTGDFENTQDSAFQSYQGLLSLADGSVTGVGLGQSAAKWFYLPEAQNDFIFAIIGEELGLVGGGLVILLFFGLGVFGMRTAYRAQNQFQALLAATLTAGIVSQAFINMAYVVGLLPVTGIQLPLISSGGTSAVITLGSMGLLASAARHEPEAVSGMQSYGRPLFDRIFMLPEPNPEGAEARREKPKNTGKDAAKRFGEPITAARRPSERAGSVDRHERRPQSRSTRTARPTRSDSVRRTRKR